MRNPSAAARDLLMPEGYGISAGGIILSSLAINILSLALPVMTLQIYDRILPNPGSGTLPVLIGGVCVAILLEAALRLARSYVMGMAGAAYEHRLSCAAIEHILHADLSRIGPVGIGEHLHRMTALGKLKDFYNGYSIAALFDLIFVPIYLGVIIYIAGPLTIVPASLLMAFTLMSLAGGQKLRAALTLRDETDDRRYNFLIESLEGVHTLKAFALENAFSRRYENLEEESTLASYRVTEATAITFNAGTVFSHLMVAAAIAVGALLALRGEITTGALIATVLLSGRMMQPVQRALALWAKYQDFTLARGKAEAIFEMPQHRTVSLDYGDAAREGVMEIEGLGFRQGEDTPWLLKDVSLRLERGESILLSGDHSAGKTALLELMTGIYPATCGEIRIDGRNILRYQPEHLVRHIGYIQAEGLIFRGTIRDNMTCFGQIPEQNAQEIAALLKVDRDIARLPAGFNTFLSGNSTDSVPPGLKQRIAMVRVLAPKPRIVLFDNADRALDREGYNLAYSLLGRLRGKAALVLVSEDHNIRALADRFFTLEEGRLREAPPPARNGRTFIRHQEIAP
jgi:ATP-binding cassette subfamily C protein LapB